MRAGWARTSPGEESLIRDALDTPTLRRDVHVCVVRQKDGQPLPQKCAEN